MISFFKVLFRLILLWVILSLFLFAGLFLFLGVDALFYSLAGGFVSIILGLIYGTKLLKMSFASSKSTSGLAYSLSRSAKIPLDLIVVDEDEAWAEVARSYFHEPVVFISKGKLRNLSENELRKLFYELSLKASRFQLPALVLVQILDRLTQPPKTVLKPLQVVHFLLVYWINTIFKWVLVYLK